MKKIVIKLNLLIFLLAFIAGIIYFACAFKTALPNGVTVNGVEVGGLTRERAEEKVRAEIISALKEKQLQINAGGTVYGYTYPEINYTDNLFSLLKTVKKNQSYTAEIKYYLCGAKQIASAICLAESVEVTEPYAEFTASGEPFLYYEGNDGKILDERKLLADINASLNGDFAPVNAAYTRVNRKTSLQTVKQNTKLLASFTTYYDYSNINRSSNIRLAAAKLNGAVLESGQTLSFNAAVGQRVKSRGFLPAKIIENGEFKEGVGGGVCQVSTTLYNAALLSGLTITEYHPHSLAVGYVPPSRDAMVSGSSCDLKITNPHATTVYIRALTGNGSVSFYIYGGGDGAEYSLSSEVTGSIPAAETETDDPEAAREGKDGSTSQSFLVIKRDGYVKKKLLRKDKYLPVKRVVYRGEETETGADN